MVCKPVLGDMMVVALSISQIDRLDKTQPFIFKYMYF